MNFIILGGGVSPERDVSKRSAAAVQSALEELGHAVTYIDPAATSLGTLLDIASGSDGVFPILHGVGGEDGVLQKEFEQHGIPFFGPDFTSASNTFNKIAYKKLLEANDLPTPRWSEISADSFASEPLITSPFVMKPIEGGSSIDTFIVRSVPFDNTPLLEALSRYETMLIEELIEGSEITVGILDKQPLPVIEIIPPTNKEFDYENKYNGETQELCPPIGVSAETQQAAQVLAKAIHELTNCRHISRTDMMIDSNGDLFAIDTNTIPGMTGQSLFPKAAAAAGIDWVSLVKKFTNLVK